MLLRLAEPEDAPAVARVHVRAWQAAYRGLLPDGYLDGLRPEDRAGRYTLDARGRDEPVTIVAVDSGGVRGFATTSPSRDPDVSDHGELCALHVDPDAWGRGLGRALITAARERLVSLGFHEAILWVLRGNARAERFYRVDGWAPDGAGRAQPIWGTIVDEVRYRRAL